MNKIFKNKTSESYTKNSKKVAEFIVVTPYRSLRKRKLGKILGNWVT